MEQSRFADARGADDGEHLAPFDMETQSSKNLDRDRRVAVRLGKIARFEERHRARIIACYARCQPRTTRAWSCASPDRPSGTRGTARPLRFRSMVRES